MKEVNKITIRTETKEIWMVRRLTVSVAPLCPACSRPLNPPGVDSEISAEMIEIDKQDEVSKNENSCNNDTDARGD